jgi:threonine/homoserine efflux transporter RhtA
MRHGPLFVMALAMIFAVAALLPVVIFKNGGIALPTFSFEGWLAVLFLGTVAGVIQFSLFMWALRWLPPTTTVLYLTLNPITAMVLGIALLGEKLTPELVAGMVLVLVGIVIGSGVYSARRITASASTCCCDCRCSDRRDVPMTFGCLTVVGYGDGFICCSTDQSMPIITSEALMTA